MTKLDQAVKAQDSIFFDKFPKQTILDKAKEKLANEIFFSSMLVDKEKERHNLEIKKLNLRRKNLHASMIIINGSEGYFKCSQGQFEIKSEFTAFEELVTQVQDTYVEVSLEPIIPTFGSQVWFINSNGLMSIFDSKVDSSD